MGSAKYGKIEEPVPRVGTMNFKIWQDEKVKGSFKDVPQHMQPARISLDKFHALADKVRQLLEPYGETFIPDAVNKSKGSNKKTTGDLDVLFVPSNAESDKDEIIDIIRNAMPNIVAEKINQPKNQKAKQPQVIMVVKDLIDDEQYMIDVIVSKAEEFVFTKFYHGFGAMVPAVVGSFARSLGYKFAQNGLHKRFKEPNGNFVNILLTGDPKMSLRILGLNPNVDKELYYPETFAKWLTDSPRFDSQKWRSPPSDDGMTIVVKNQKAHRAAKLKQDVQKAYEIIDNTSKKSFVNNDNMQIERQLLGNEFIEKILKDLQMKVQKQKPVLNGFEIMQILKINQGPEVKKWVEFLKTHPQLQGKNLNDPKVKEFAKQLLLLKKQEMP